MSIANDERQISIDAVRGFAVLGILLMNIVGMGLPAFAYLDPTYYGGGHPADLWTWAINFVLTDGKMRGLFTMLFGASTVLIAERAEGGPLSPAATHYRRMLWLFVFGLLHAYLFWYGDILVCYAIACLAIFPLRKLPPALLIAIGAAILAGLLGYSLFAAGEIAALKHAAAAPGAPSAITAMWRQYAQFVDPSQQDAARQIAGFRGDVVAAFRARSEINAVLYVAFVPNEVVEAVGQMLIGAALYRLGFFSLKWSSRAYWAMIAVGYLIAAPATAWIAWRLWSAHFDPIALQYATAWSAAPRPFIALAHASVIMLIVRSGALGWLVNRFAAAGRMALSNYLATSIITAFVFCGFGLGLFGALSRAELLWVVAGVWAFILIWSKPWLARYHYGPFEWVWRSLVRWRAQPFRKTAPIAA
jgi:uncharacterized protein